IGDPDHHLSAVEPVALDAVGVVSGEAVVQLESRSGQPATVHRAEGQLSFECAEQHQILEDIRRSEDAVDAGPLERGDEAPQQFAAIGHRLRIRTDLEDPACGMVHLPGTSRHQPNFSESRPSESGARYSFPPGTQTQSFPSPKLAGPVLRGGGPPFGTVKEHGASRCGCGAAVQAAATSMSADTSRAVD